MTLFCLKLIIFLFLDGKEGKNRFFSLHYPANDLTKSFLAVIIKGKGGVAYAEYRKPISFEYQPI